VKLLVVIPVLLGMIGLRFLRPNLLMWALAWWVGLLITFRFGFATPIPASVIAIYMGIATLALIAYCTSSKERLRAVVDPLVRLVVERRYRPVLAALIVLVPALLGVNTYLKSKVPIQPPFFARTIHPAPPASIEVHGKNIDLVRGVNPFRALEKSDPEQFKTHLANGSSMTSLKDNHFCADADASFQAALSKANRGTITTEIRDAPQFYYAEEYHQQYLAKNPNGYCGLGGCGVNYPPAVEAV